MLMVRCQPSPALQAALDFQQSMEMLRESLCARPFRTRHFTVSLTMGLLNYRRLLRATVGRYSEIPFSCMPAESNNNGISDRQLRNEAHRGVGSDPDHNRP